jgi:hypothetical protein
MKSLAVIICPSRKTEQPPFVGFSTRQQIMHAVTPRSCGGNATQIILVNDWRQPSPDNGLRKSPALIAGVVFRRSR